MKKVCFMSMLVFCGLVFLSTCTSVKTWPDYEKSTKNRMVVIHENIMDGAKTNLLTTEWSQSFLTILESIRTDYTEMKDRKVYQDEWNSLLRKLDILGEQVNKALARDTRVKILAQQRRIDDGRINGLLLLTERRKFQSKMDSIRGDYLWMTEGGRYPTYEERTDISRRLKSVETNLNLFE